MRGRRRRGTGAAVVLAALLSAGLQTPAARVAGEEGEAVGRSRRAAERPFAEVRSAAQPQAGQDIRDIKPLQDLTGSLRPALALATIVLLAGAAAAWLWRRHGEGQTAGAREPAHVEALAALDRLHLPAAEDGEALRGFGFALSEIVRRYLEARFSLNATDLTTEEIAAALGGVAMEVPERERLAVLLVECDQVKFAAARPGRGALERNLRRAFAFVEATRLHSPERSGREHPA